MRLRDHLVDLELATAMGVDRDAHRKAMQRALGDGFVSSCEARLSETDVACALRARDSAAVAACSTSISRR